MLTEKSVKQTLELYIFYVNMSKLASIFIKHFYLKKIIFIKSKQFFSNLIQQEITKNELHEKPKD